MSSGFDPASDSKANKKTHHQHGGYTPKPVEAAGGGASLTKVCAVPQAPSLALDPLATLIAMSWPVHHLLTVHQRRSRFFTNKTIVIL
jgi:hypothetical protein